MEIIGKRILIVEDEQLIARSLQGRLMRLGYPAPVMAASGEAALVAVSQTPVDLILMDVRLKGKLDGIQAAGLIRTRMDIPVIYLTALSDTETINRAQQTMPYAYLTKPVESGELEIAIHVALYKHRIDRQFSLLNQIAMIIANSTNLTAVLPLVLQNALLALEMEAGWVQIDGNSGCCPEMFASVGMPAQFDPPQECTNLGEALCSYLNCGSPVMVWQNTPGNMVAVPAYSGDYQDRFGKLNLSKPNQADYLLITGELHQLNIPLPEMMVLAPVLVGSDLCGMIVGCTSQRVDPEALQAHFLNTVSQLIGSEIHRARLLDLASQAELYQEFNRLRSELVANVSHELRTPMGLIKIYASTLLREDIQIDQATQRSFLGDIIEEMEKLEAIVANLLDLSRLENSRLRLEYQTFDMIALLSNLAGMFQASLPGSLRITIAQAEPVIVHADLQRIEQVFRNLLANAVKYSPGGGEILAGARVDELQVLVWVQDQGIGIPDSELERIFERFYRVENETTRRVGGAGLGLSLCRGIVEAHGGSIWVDSQPGVGSTFYVTLPVQENGKLEEELHGQ